MAEWAPIEDKNCPSQKSKNMQKVSNGSSTDTCGSIRFMVQSFA